MSVLAVNKAILDIFCPRLGAAAVEAVGVCKSVLPPGESLSLSYVLGHVRRRRHNVDGNR